MLQIFLFQFRIDQIERNSVFIKYCCYRNEKERSGARASSTSRVGGVGKRSSAGRNPVDRNGAAASPTCGNQEQILLEKERGNNIITYQLN